MAACHVISVRLVTTVTPAAHVSVGGVAGCSVEDSGRFLECVCVCVVCFVQPASVLLRVHTIAVVIV